MAGRGAFPLSLSGSGGQRGPFPEPRGRHFHRGGKRVGGDWRAEPPLPSEARLHGVQGGGQGRAAHSRGVAAGLVPPHVPRAAQCGASSHAVVAGPSPTTMPHCFVHLPPTVRTHLLAAGANSAEDLAGWWAGSEEAEADAGRLGWTEADRLGALFAWSEAKRPAIQRLPRIRIPGELPIAPGPTLVLALPPWPGWALQGESRPGQFNASGHR